MCPALQMSVLDAWLHFISQPGSSAGSMVSGTKYLLYRGRFGFHRSERRGQQVQSDGGKRARWRFCLFLVSENRSRLKPGCCVDVYVQTG